MKIWKKLSTVSIWSGGFIALFWQLFGKYFQPFTLAFLIIVSFGLSLFLFSELMKLILKIKAKSREKQKAILKERGIDWHEN
jgi:hypothetical protein